MFGVLQTGEKAFKLLDAHRRAGDVPASAWAGINLRVHVLEDSACDRKLLPDVPSEKFLGAQFECSIHGATSCAVRERGA